MKVKLAWLAIGLVLAVLALVAGWLHGNLSGQVSANLEWNRRVVALLDAVIAELDNPARAHELAARLRAFRASYAVTYEDPGFWDLMAQHLDRSEPRKE